MVQDEQALNISFIQKGTFKPIPKCGEGVRPPGAKLGDSSPGDVWFWLSLFSHSLCFVFGFVWVWHRNSLLLPIRLHTCNTFTHEAHIPVLHSSLRWIVQLSMWYLCYGQVMTRCIFCILLTCRWLILFFACASGSFPLLHRCLATPSFLHLISVLKFNITFSSLVSVSCLWVQHRPSISGP